MSHYTEVATEYRDKECLVKALKELGYPEVEVHDGDGAHLYGYMGDVRPQKANVIVRRKHVGSAANDLGFVWDAEKGCFREIISEYDVSSKHVNHKLLKQAYTEHKVTKEAKARGFSVMNRSVKDGKRYLTLRRAY